MKKSIINKIFIYAFLFLYGLVAFISFCHAIEFFDIGNVNWMSIMLAFAFELGLAVCLASILIGTNKNNNIAWILLVILVLVQVVGNTYSVFKYISDSEAEYYTYLAKPLLFFIEDVSEETVQIIISWIMGAILPVVALLMTEMVANGIKEQQIDSEIAADGTIDRETINSPEIEKEPVTEQISEDNEGLDDHDQEDDIVEENEHNDEDRESLDNDYEDKHDSGGHDNSRMSKFFKEFPSKIAEKIPPETK